MAAKKEVFKVAGRDVTVTNPQKVYFPAAGYTKLDLVLYYLAVADGALAKTGEHAECVNGFGVFDMVGNLHEWVATDPAALHGTFAGGYYLDTTINGDGCLYRTQAHAHDYHDYSTGFRCCGAAGAP